MKHRDRLRAALLLGLLFSGTLGNAGSHLRDAPLSALPRFVVYYGTLDDVALYRYDIAVLDSDIEPAILARFDPASLVLGYLSLGEVHIGRTYADQLIQQGMLLVPNRNWAGARFVDLRDARWRQRILDQLVPEILARGFGGLFLDTLDSAAYLEASDPVRFAGMTGAAAEVVLSIRQRFPQLPIMVNRGYAVLPRIAASIDMLLGESVHTTYDADAQAYLRVAPESIQWQYEQMRAARRLNPSLRLFSLDYWSPMDPQGMARIYVEAQANGFIPYVATIDLSRIVARP